MAEADFLSDLSDGCADLLSELGASVTYDQPGADAFALTVIWDEGSGKPTSAWTALSGFPLLNSGDRMTPAPGDRIARSGHLYKVMDKPAVDGTGGVTLTLRMIGAA